MQIRRFIFIVLYCCWLPLSGAAAAAFGCHASDVATPTTQSAQNHLITQHHPATPHHPEQQHHLDPHNVSHQPPAPVNSPDVTAEQLHCGETPAMADSAAPADDSMICDQCQSSCHTSPLFLVSGSTAFIHATQVDPSLFTLPSPEIVFPAYPQRPPQRTNT